VQGFYKLTDHPAEWYAENGFEYLVFSQGMFARFYREPTKYAAEVARYEALFDASQLVRQFTDGGYEVRIYHLGAGKP
jgi:hypothetical protein